MIDGEVDPGDGFGQWCYHDRHSFGMGWKVKLMDEVWQMEG